MANDEIEGIKVCSEAQVGAELAERLGKPSRVPLGTVDGHSVNVIAFPKGM